MSYAHQDAVTRQVQDLLGRDEPVSRNRHFELFRGRRGRAALRLYRVLRALGRELDSAAGHRDMRVELRPGDGDLWLELSDPERSYTHRTRVPQALLPWLRGRLARLGLTPPAGEDT